MTLCYDWIYLPDLLLFQTWSHFTYQLLNSMLLFRSTFLRLCSGLEEYLRSGLSKQEEASHGQGEAPGAAVPHHLKQCCLGCFPSSRFESSHLFKPFHKYSSTLYLYSFSFRSIFCIDGIWWRWWSEGPKEVRCSKGEASPSMWQRGSQ